MPEPLLFATFNKWPHSPGGHKAFAEFVKEKIVYPESAKRDGKEGVVMLQFQVDTRGSVPQCKILKSVRRDIDEEAVRVLLSSKWMPKVIGERKADSYMKVPIIFSLQ
jgi:TonB family protein